MLVSVVGKTNLVIFNSLEKERPMLRDIYCKRLINVIEQVGGPANNKVGLPDTDIMKQFKADIATIGNIGDPQLLTSGAASFVPMH